MKVGKVGRRNFTLPVELGVRTAAIHGIRGTGKTVTASVFAEELLKANMQVVVIDPTDSWWGLKSSLDGKRDGFPIIVLGGDHGDVPLEDSAGRVLADFVVDQRASVVLSLRHLRKARQRHLVMEFFEQLYHLKGRPENRTPLTVFLDEASIFIPQKVYSGKGEQLPRLVGSVEDIVRRGRHAGFGMVIVDQRPASVNKDVLTQIELLVCHRITSPQDRTALDGWIKQHDSEGHRDEFLADLASLPVGEAYFWSPAADVFGRVQVRMRETFDSSKTPKLGEDPVTPDQVAAIDLDVLREQMSAAIAKAEASDPKALQRRIRELEKEIREASAGGTSEEDLEGARAEGRQQAKAELGGYIEELEKKISDAAPDIETAASKLGEVLSLLRNGTTPPPVLQEPSPKPARPARPARPRRAPGERPAPRGQSRSVPPPSHSAGQLSGPQRRIIDTLAELDAIGINRPERGVVAVLSGASPTSSAYANNLGRLRSGFGLIDYPSGGLVELTHDGRGAAAPPDVPLSLEQLHESFKKHLSGPQGRILDVLVQAFPDWVSREQLAGWADASPTSSAFANNLGRMRTLGIIDYPESGFVAATGLLFPAGLS